MWITSRHCGTVDLIDQECQVDFIDINMGCPIDIVVNKGAGSALLTKPMLMKGIVQAASGTVDSPITIKVLNSIHVLHNSEQQSTSICKIAGLAE
ncbi:hypothetical protein ACFX1T_034404 [Malus domestica]